MTCDQCRGHVTVDEQNDQAVCPWCGHLNVREKRGAETGSS